MKVSYVEGLANHNGPESCGAAREGGDEALTGERTGRVYSRVRNSLRDADAVRRSGRLHPRGPISRGAPGIRAVTDPEHVPKHLQRNREIPRSPQGELAWGRIGKSKDARR